ncbi:hypothetical protein AC623_18185 [Bacillus sp. FJAT-27231]|uniref:hypothetical protein n=1 Tax=Bacillus sp. FJAT-27231 TaxID=1679168 RepID=UPI00067123A5|nr:hypothetical protein [Bacillus sp. FJAT-27231]KMY55620.1 hypothetical protein AC623_18185 [Bacillus sp. FJAT-27231]
MANGTWVNPQISSVTYSDSYRGNPISNGQFIGWNANRQYGWITLNFAEPQTFDSVKISAYAQPASSETYTLYKAGGIKIGQSTQMVSEAGSAFVIPVTSGTYSSLTIYVSVGVGQSWAEIQQVLLGFNN